MMVAPLWNWIFFDVSASCWRLPLRGVWGGRINKSWTRNFDAIACNKSTAMLISLIEDSKWKLQLLGDVWTLMWDVPSVQEILIGYMLGTVFVRANWVLGLVLVKQLTICIRHIYIPSGNLTHRHRKSPSFLVFVSIKMVDVPWLC